MEKLSIFRRMANAHSRFILALQRKLAEGEFVMTKEVFLELMDVKNAQA